MYKQEKCECYFWKEYYGLYKAISNCKIISVISDSPMAILLLLK